jgi:multiple sugar transport system substrate-binding protein
MSEKPEKGEESKRISRRRALRYGAAAVVVAAAAAGGAYYYSTVPPSTPTTSTSSTVPPSTPTTSTTLAQPFAGTTITYSAYAPLSDGLRPLLADFQKKTGINVQMTVFSVEEGSNKVALNLSGHTGALDVVTAFIENVGAFAPYEVPLDPLVEKYGVDLSDFVKPAINGMRFDEAHMFDPEGGGTELSALPMNASLQFLAYQKDWFEDPKEKSNFENEYGYELRPPNTWKEMCDVLEFFTRPADGIYGYGLPGRPFEWAEHSGAWAFSRGENYTNLKGVPAFNTPGQVEAWSLMSSFYKNKWVPPGSEANGYDEVTNLFLAKKVAMLYNWSYSYGALEIPSSPVKGHVGYALTPMWGEPIGKPRDLPPGVTSWVVPGSYSRTGQGAWNLAIANSSKNIDAAFQFISWATTRDVALKIADSVGYVEALSSVYADPGVQAKFPFAKTMLDIWAGNHAWIFSPRAPPWTSWMSEAEPVLHDILTGKVTVKQALDEANDMMVKIWKQAGYPTS